MVYTQALAYLALYRVPCTEYMLRCWQQKPTSAILITLVPFRSLRHDEASLRHAPNPASLRCGPRSGTRGSWAVGRGGRASWPL
jgi:hypothetical protein